ncbi:MAG: CaiB/BaiF CoA transferase family protein [bacterium]
MAGPVAGRMLADMGADVIKVEKSSGDDTRRMVPPSIAGESAAFMMMNRNKRGVVLNLKSKKGKEALLRLIKDADVLIENYRLGTMEGLGLGYDQLKRVNKGLIYCEISGFGRTGPYAARGGFDLIAQGMSGLMSITGEAPGRPPVKSGAPVTDITAGILGAMGISAAYAHKLQTGLGQKVDTSLFEAGITQTYWQSAIALATGEAPTAMGSAHPLNAPYQAFQTQDGWINVGAANQTNWERLTVLIDRPELQNDPRFSSNDLRMNNRDQLVDVLSDEFKKFSTEHWLHRFDQGGLPVGPILSVTEMHNDPQAIARNMVINTRHPIAGEVKTLGMPVKFSETSCEIRSPAPLLGQHTRQVLGEAGYSTVEIEQMIVSGDAAESEPIHP